MNLRSSVVLGMWAAQTLVVWLGTPLLMGELSAYPGWMLSREGIVISLTVGGIVAVLQGLFLLPVRKPGLKPTARSVWMTIGTAGLAAAVLFTGLFMSMVEVCLTLLEIHFPGLDPGAFWMTLAVMGAAWAVATPLLISFTRPHQRETALGRIAAGLFTGTLVEVVAIVPLDVMIRRKHDCYCIAGTFVALVLCGGVGLFALGPAIYLPILARRRKRWYAGHCAVCGYDMSGNPGADRCPECGSGWRTVDAGEA